MTNVYYLMMMMTVIYATRITAQHNSFFWNRSLHAYDEFRSHIREPLPSGRPYAFWDKWRPAFTCPLLDRFGRLSDGGKNVCNWEALFLPRPPSDVLPGVAAMAPCVLYSFGISGDATFEEELMERLKGSGCKLYGFDPTVDDFPQRRPGGVLGSPLATDEPGGHKGPFIIHNAEFSKSALVAPSEKAAAEAKGWDAGSLEDFMKARNHEWIDILKVDIEGSEWHLFDDICKRSPKDPKAMPFDMLLIELHGVHDALLQRFMSCLESHGLYLFAREENLHNTACSNGRGPETHDITEVEMSFVRGRSRFTLVPQLSEGENFASSPVSLSHGRHRQLSSARERKGTRIPSVLKKSKETTRRKNMRQNRSKANGLALSGLSIRPRSIDLLSTVVVNDTRIARASSVSDASSFSTRSSVPGQLFAKLPPRRRHTIRYREALAMRYDYLHKIHAHALTSANQGKNENSEWATQKSFRCSQGPVYLWDLFEPRGWCTEKVWVLGWPVIREWMPKTSFKPTQAIGSDPMIGSRAFCRSDVFRYALSEKPSKGHDRHSIHQHHQQHYHRHHHRHHQGLPCLISLSMHERPSPPFTGVQIATDEDRSAGQAYKMKTDKGGSIDEEKGKKFMIRKQNIALALKCAPQLHDNHSTVAPSSSQSLQKVEKFKIFNESMSSFAPHFSRLSIPGHYRILAADIISAHDWLDFHRLACIGGNSDEFTFGSPVQSSTLIYTNTDDSLTNSTRRLDGRDDNHITKGPPSAPQGDDSQREEMHGSKIRFSARFEQMVLSMTLVGRDVVGPTANAARSAAIPKGASVPIQPPMPVTPATKLELFDEDFPKTSIEAWAAPAAAILGPAIACLEDDGFQLVHREVDYDKSYDDETYNRLGVPAPKHTATMTFVNARGAL